MKKTNKETYNIGFHFIKATEGFEDRMAILSPRGTISHAKLRNLVFRYASLFQSEGIDQQSCAAVHTKFLYNSLAIPLALSLLGAKWCQATPLLFQSKEIDITAQILDSNGPLAPGLSPDKLIKIIPSVVSSPADLPGDPSAFSGCSHPQDLQMITHSSGTTGIPKFMGWSFENVMRWQWIAADIEGDPIPVVANMFPMLSILGWFYNLCAIIQGGTIVFSFQHDYLIQHGVNHIVGSPIQFSHLIQGQPAPPRPDSVTAHITGGAVPDMLQEKLARFFNRRFAIYGSTEAGPVCISEIGPSPSKERALGRPLDNVQVRILDENGLVCPPGQEGIVSIKTPLLVNGYIGNPEATKQIFKDNWFYPGDIGKINDNGELVLVGRVNDILNLGGHKLNAADIDGNIQAIEGVSDGICFVETEETGIAMIAAVVQISETADPKEVTEAVRKACQKVIRSKQLFHGHIYIVDHIPRNESGKPLRRECRNLINRLQAR